MSGGDDAAEKPELAMIRQCHQVTSSLVNFLEDVIPPETPTQTEIVQETLKDPTFSRSAGMLSGHLVGQLLKMVAEMTQAKSILEIGTYTGYGAVTLAETSLCKEVITLDNEPYCKEFLAKHLEGKGHLKDKIRSVIGPAIESLQLLKEEGKRFDLVFIDADKSSYINYYKFILANNLLEKGGVILCDNILWGNDTFLEKASPQGQALFDFVQFVKQDDRVEQMIFPFRDGVFLIRLKN
ncbi:caffeoyl-CoA O-methyltransferase 2 isoform X2 [Folsomia candida]|nr:caffeoyl-CoA O-methyltransferase 2 isoform X2 [Folsomia candida]